MVRPLYLGETCSKPKYVPDLTDRFDFSFLCGDLNFRLDITRLHADWLISRQGMPLFPPEDSIAYTPSRLRPSPYLRPTSQGNEGRGP